MDMRVTPEGDRQAAVLFFRPLADEVVAKDRRRVGSLLGFDLEARGFRMAYGTCAARMIREIAWRCTGRSKWCTTCTDPT